MNMKMREKIISYILAVVMCFWGMSVVTTTETSSFSCLENSIGTATSVLRSVEHLVEEPAICTPIMVGKSASIIRSNTSNSMMRWLDRDVLMFLFVGSFLQYLFCYQSAECKEDGRIFSSRTAIVDYIHLKDSGE